eukprot:GEMP01015335.1.p1 GENE.GEMP01015335.1~~GEMP01015335.1.p1  ORF type:complete len:884 (+),score=179.77 GEMP01015335.1:241-2892(+)
MGSRPRGSRPPPQNLYVFQNFSDEIVSQQDIHASVSVHDGKRIFAEHQTGLYEDEQFPASTTSINGPLKKQNGVVKCRCGVPATQARAARTGHEYYRCSMGRCPFFQYMKVLTASCSWARLQPPTYLFVRDAGFLAEDLLQGGVGDCWFLSALSCVAERPDLVMRLFPEHVANTRGIYQVCLFMDGVWRGFCVDDRLPINYGSLCYSHANHMQLWVPILEKAYAKAHGSYRAIVGGCIAEAFTDLTGCPSETYNFDHQLFRPRDFWEKLVEFRRHRVPMGCATTGVRGLGQVGLVPNHAYSILDLREFPNMHHGDKNVTGFTDATLRLVRIRNPHGRGEWNGAWSDSDVKWQHLNLDLTTNKNDGTFWMAYEDFLMGFQIVDVSLAYENLHSRSYACEFPPKLRAERCCGRSFKLSAFQDTVLYLMVCQPTKRGAWCRADRKVSYKQGDVGIVVRYSSGQVGGKMFGVKRIAHLRVELKAKETISCIPVALGFPLASESGAFVLRLVSTQPVKVEKEPAVTGISFARMMQDFSLSCPRKRTIHQSDAGKIIVCRGGSAVFVMAFTRETTGIRLLAKARGMGCRGVQGLVPHETKGPVIKYRACWRHFKINATVQPGSQIVATLFQSGVDWEFGSVEGSFGPVEEHRSSAEGIFLPDSDEERWKVDACSDESMGAGIILINPGGADGELEAALALSRKEHEFNDSVALSREDQEFNKAIAMALQLSQHAHVPSVSSGSSTPAIQVCNTLHIPDSPIARNQVSAEDKALQAALNVSRDEVEQDFNAILERSRHEAHSTYDLDAALTLSRREFYQNNSATIEIDTDGIPPVSASNNSTDRLCPVDLTEDDGAARLAQASALATRHLVILSSSEDEESPQRKRTKNY